ncbi:N-acetylglucosamine-6-sulfatase-like isoform X2 [Diorhabda carinulata]|nr:N-acetylglucosamine-6-sulfatase-like isoform X2 [Diorhabda carinulata]XP_057663661.1 N-acetylglucosamine-6-sulfatase-like isoform X2 [Diorhabda carinulata]XP_057663662.1 N-acetylglucosamine-6-sulfatase-like isoform X2 [Diorhabda carinulata]XP_057663663.1 N-acetylglucosamine-6-sulfatase-like isoform X2 [Diorhabda carinulata]
MTFLWFRILILATLYQCFYGDPNFVLVLTDDQDLLLNSMIAMENTINLLGNNGKTFKNAFVNTPICCPSRSTILTGKFAHNTGVVNNSISGNCSSPMWQEKHEPNSVSAILKRNKNYVTFYSGKYMNGYGFAEAGGIEHVPEGYDWWIGLKGNSVYYNYTLSINGTEYFSSDKYLTDTLAEYSIKFLEQRATDRPFFMTIAPPAAHAPFTPAKRHENKYAGTKAVRSPSFNHSGSDKHWLIRMPPEYLPDDVDILDKVQQHRLESLLAVDELVQGVVSKLEMLDLLKDTYIIFTSDHGFHIGQFSQPWDKRQPYETDIRVPFIVSGPKIPAKSSETFPISAVDIVPTILDLANIDVPSYIDGISFKKQLFAEPSDSFNKTILIEYWGEGDTRRIDPKCAWTDPNLTECIPDQWCKCQDSRNNTFTCMVELTESQNFKFCRFNDEENFLEAYNLTVDPFELKNVANELNSGRKQHYLSIMENLQKCRGSECKKMM